MKTSKPKQMQRKHPLQISPSWLDKFPGDNQEVLLLIDEAVRLAELGQKWSKSNPVNPIAVEYCFHTSWAHAVSATWLRCRLKGEVGPQASHPPKGGTSKPTKGKPQ